MARIGKNRAKFTVRVIDNFTNKSKSFIVDDNIDIVGLVDKIKRGINNGKQK